MGHKQITDTVFMVEPVAFGFNAATAGDNFFQRFPTEFISQELQDQALKEFSYMRKILEANGIRVMILKDTEKPHTPDSIFPNNWVSFHDDGTAVLYPMFAENRRLERRPRELMELFRQENIHVKRLLDLAKDGEGSLRFLEGTGSMVVDRTNRVVYAALSERTSEEGVGRFCREMGFDAVTFSARHKVGSRYELIYHTNVMMSIGDNLAVVCFAAITDQKERDLVRQTLEKSGRCVVELTMEQVNNFAGNVLQLCNRYGEKILVASKRAWSSLRADQRWLLESLNTGVITVPLDTVEVVGGGSARCMLAEVFLHDVLDS